MTLSLLRHRKASPKSSKVSLDDSAPTVIRCAIYTRKSTEEGLEQEFNSLHAQREACENYIKSQTSQGWQAIPKLYDDGGFTGGNIERPALKLLLEDIQAGEVDCVLVYKVDRLSRSLIDFSRLMEIFQAHDVSFVSVTQQFSTATSGGRLFLNMLLSFAQYERELISERTRDKMHLARRRGKWTGGKPVLGYDLQDGKLVVNHAEAAVIQELFCLYLEHGSLRKVAQAASARGWANKSWVKRDGSLRVGGALDKTALHRILTNPLYTGRTHCQGELFTGEHQAIVKDAVFNRVQDLLEANSPDRQRPSTKSAALLKGLIRCGVCQAAMVPSSSRKGSKVYRYYVCTKAQKLGHQSCPHPNWPAQVVEEAVLNQVKGRLHTMDILAAVLDELQRQSKETRRRMTSDKQRLEQDRAFLHNAAARDRNAKARLAEIQEKLLALDQTLDNLNNADFSAPRLSAALSSFDQVWQALSAEEQQRLLSQLVAGVTVDGSEVEIGFHPVEGDLYGQTIPG